MSNMHRYPNKRLRSILPGRPLKIREGLYSQLRDREWIFNRTENNLIFLIHKNGAFGVVVGIEDIDWSGCWWRQWRRKEASEDEKEVIGPESGSFNSPGICSECGRRRDNSKAVGKCGWLRHLCVWSALHARHAADDLSTGASVTSNYYEVTEGVAIKPFPNDRVLSKWLFRPEFRYDHSYRSVFDSGDRNQWTFNADVLLTFEDLTRVRIRLAV